MPLGKGNSQVVCEVESKGFQEEEVEKSEEAKTSCVGYRAAMSAAKFDRL